MEITFPRADIGLFQNDVEVVRTPAYDLTTFVAREEPRWNGEDRWRVHQYNERTFGDARDHPRLDALVIGFNAIHQHRTRLLGKLRRQPPEGNMLMLHQLEPACFGFLTGNCALKAVELPNQGTQDVAVPPERDATEEPLLQWPRATAVDDQGAALKCKALLGFELPNESLWRVVLELRQGGDRYPVVVRTARVVPERIVVCSLLLEWRNESHGDFLENMLTYCATGPPDVAVIDESPAPPGYQAGLLTDRLRLRGANAYRCNHQEGGPLAIGVAPLNLARHLVIPAGIEIGSILSDTTSAASWFSGGGVVARVGVDSEISLHSGATDANWVADRWATWYSAADPEAKDGWQSSILAARAVLRMLKAITSRPEESPLSLTRPTEYPIEPLVELLDRRVKNGNCEETISATAAALELDELTGGRLLNDKTRSSVREWLRNSFDRAPAASELESADAWPPPIEDRLDIARVLADSSCLRVAYQSMVEGPVTALGLTRLREALLACGPHSVDVKVLAAVASQADAATVCVELESNALLSAEFLAAAVALHLHSGNHPLASLEGKAVRVAAATVSRRSVIARLGRDEMHPTGGTQLSTEALALMLHATARPSSTWQIHPESQDIPASAVEEVIRQTHRTREALEAEAQASKRALSALSTATWLLGAVTVGALSLVVAWRFNAVEAHKGDWVLLLVAVLLAFMILAIVRHLRRRSPDGAVALAGDVLAVIGLVIAVSLSYFVFLIPWTDIVLGPLFLLALGAAAGALLYALRRVDVPPTWGPAAAAWLEQHGAPMPKGWKESAKTRGSDRPSGF